MKDIVTPVPPEEVRSVIKKCLENAALVNYTRISEYAKIEGEFMIAHVRGYHHTEGIISAVCEYHGNSLSTLESLLKTQVCS